MSSFTSSSLPKSATLSPRSARARARAVPQLPAPRTAALVSSILVLGRWRSWFSESVFFASAKTGDIGPVFPNGEHTDEKSEAEHGNIPLARNERSNREDRRNGQGGNDGSDRHVAGDF